MEIGRRTNPVLVLASASPRRSELMSEAGYEFEVMAPAVEEAHDEALGCGSSRSCGPGRW